MEACGLEESLEFCAQAEECEFAAEVFAVCVHSDECAQPHGCEHVDVGEIDDDVGVCGVFWVVEELCCDDVGLALADGFGEESDEEGLSDGLACEEDFGHGACSVISCVRLLGLGGGNRVSGSWSMCAGCYQGFCAPAGIAAAAAVGGLVKGTGLPSASTETSVMLACVTGTWRPVRNRSASTSTATVTLVLPSLVVLV